MGNEKNNTGAAMPQQQQSSPSDDTKAAGLRGNPQARADWDAKRSAASAMPATVPGAVATNESSSSGKGSNKRGLRRRSKEVQQEPPSKMETMKMSPDAAIKNDIANQNDKIMAGPPEIRKSHEHSTAPQPVLGSTTIGAMPMAGTQAIVNEYDDEPVQDDLETQRPNDFLVEATLVTPKDDEEEEQRPSAELAKVVEAEQLYCGFSKRQLLYVGGLLVLIAVIVVVVTLATGGGGGDQNDASLFGSATPSPTATPLPTLEAIRQRGELLCGVWDESRSFVRATGVLENKDDQIDLVLCRALAAAVLGNASAVQIVETSQKYNFVMLDNRTVDVLASHVETSMQADVYEDEDGRLPQPTGFAFSVPYLYTDIFWTGNQTFVECMEDDFNTKGECSNLKVCMNTGSEWADIVEKRIPESFIMEFKNVLEILQGFRNGDCNVFPAEETGVAEHLLKWQGFRGELYRGTKAFVSDVATIATRDDDPTWSDFVNIILMGLMAAEQAKVSRDNAAQMLLADVLGEELERAVAAVGNYAEIFERGWEPVVKGRTGWDLLNNGTTGLLFTLPLGKVLSHGPGPTPGGTLEAISIRPDSKLRCGVRLGHDGFAMHDEEGDLYTGLDVDMCAALASSLSGGTPDSVEYVDVGNEAKGYEMLQSGEVDVLAGFVWSIQNDYQEPGTGEGYSFSQPYFYQPLEDLQNMTASFDENHCLVTRQDDPQFSSFVYWVVASTWYAEEIGAEYNDMTDVNLFGPDYSKMFRNAIYAVGNYGEMWDRNLEHILPRGGRNMINSVRETGPQLYVPPGFFG